MRNIFCLLTIFLTQIAFAQVSIEPIMGLSYDIKNKQHFTYINGAIQISIKATSGYELALGFSKSFGLTQKTTDSSFTLNPSLPVYVPVQKTLQPAAYSIYTNHRILLKKTNNSSWYINLLLGFSGQRFDILYNYNRTDYSILNPETSIKGFGVFTGGGFEYMYQLKKGRLFIQTHICTQPLTKNPSKFNSFEFNAPLSINAGYSIPLTRSKPVAQN